MSAHDRAIGALVGLACGDAVGTPLEFKRPGSFEPIDDMVGGGTWGLAAGQWTDDTSMALCLAQSLLDRGGHDPADQLRRYLLWHDEGYLSSTGQCFDIGTTTSRSLERFRRTGEVADPSPDEDYATNGSLMRLAPVAIRWHRDMAEVMHFAAASSRTTHAARRCVDACRVLASMTAALINSTEADEVFGMKFGDLHPDVAAVTAGSWRHKQPPDIQGRGAAVAALEAAICAVAGASDFRSAVLRAANLGDDADTTAAIAGQLAGARWGLSGIPTAWVELLHDSTRIHSLAHNLFVAGGGEVDNVGWPFDDVLHAWRVADGVLAGEYPGDRQPSLAKEKLNLLLDAGVRLIVDLTTPADRLALYAEKLERIAGERSLSVEVESLPIPDLDVIDALDYDRVVEVIERATKKNGTAYIHCWGGIGRTGTVVGWLLGRRGMSYDDAIRHIEERRANTRKAHRRCPEMNAQHDLLRATFGD